MANGLRIRQFTVCQFEENPRTGEKIADLAQIAANLAKYKSFTTWAWCIHDRDVYTQDAIDDMRCTLEHEAKAAGLTDEAAIAEYVKNNAWAEVGWKKNKHIHIVVRAKYQLTIEQIARCLGVPEHLVHIITGKGALLDCTQYLTHEDEKQQELGKIRYDDREVHTSSDFSDWRQQLNDKELTELKYGKGKTRVQKCILDVLKYGKTLSQCYRDMDGNDYSDNLNKLLKARAEYLEKAAELPNTRLSFYVCGDGGMGKGILCELLARALVPDIEQIGDIVFGFGGDNVGFDGYDGQPVIIWNEMRAAQFISNLGRRATLTVFDAHPKTQDGCVNVKFGKTKLIHRFNIINGIEPYEDFIKGLAGEYIDRNGHEHHAEDANLEQFRRRIPVIIPIDENSVSILVNLGVFNGTREYDQYQSYATLVGNFQKTQQLCGANQGLLIDMTKPIVEPVVEVSEHLKKKIDTPEFTEDEARKRFAAMGFGRVIKGDLEIEGSTLHTDETLVYEYEQVFTPLWQSLHKPSDYWKMESFRTWVSRGCPTCYDPKKGEFYRPLDITPTE